MSRKLPPAVLDYFRKEGSKGGKKGGHAGGKIGGPARASKLTPERRAEIAKKAAAARWGKKPKDAAK